MEELLELMNLKDVLFIKTDTAKKFENKWKELQWLTRKQRGCLWVGPFYRISFRSEFWSPVLDKSLLQGVFWGHTQT